MGCELLLLLNDLQNQHPGVPTPMLFNGLVSAIYSAYGREIQASGVAAEPVVSRMLEIVIGTKEDPTFAKAAHGLDARHVAEDRTVVAIESKTTDDSSRTFASRLDPTDDGKQMSDQWLSGRGVDPNESVSESSWTA